MMDALMIPEYYYRAAAHPANKWGVPETRNSLLEHWSLFALENIAYFQHDTIYYYESDKVISKRVEDFAYGSSMEQLHN